MERRVDTLLRMDTEDGEFILAVESQGKRASDKPASWAYYLSHLYAKYGIPPVLLVVCADRSTAAWAARQVDIGPPQWPSLTLRPLVLGPDSLPVIASPDETARDIPLTVLSAALHRRDPDADAILNALARRGRACRPTTRTPRAPSSNSPNKVSARRRPRISGGT